MDTTDVTARHARLAEVEERIDRIGKRLIAGYGTDSDRDGWLTWLRQLETQRARLLAAIADDEEPAVAT